MISIVAIATGLIEGLRGKPLLDTHRSSYDKRTIIVAAHDSSPRAKAMADIVCRRDDHDRIR